MEPRLAIRLVLTGLLLASNAIHCHAQSFGTLLGTASQPLSAETSTKGITDAAGTIVDVFVANNGSDICQDIKTVWQSQFNLHATMDARGFQGAPNGNPWTCSISPFPTGATGRLLLGNVLIGTNASWQIPSGVEVIGMGVSSAAGSTNPNTLSPTNTVIAASGTFPVNTAVLEMGATANSYGIKIKDLTVDCASGGVGQGRPGCIGIENINAGQNSSVEDVAIDNAPAEGLHVTIGNPSTPAAAYSGPYRNITVQYPTCTSGSTGCPHTYGVVVDCTSCSSTSPSPVPVHFDNITGQAAGTNTDKNGFYVTQAPVILTNSHFENYLGTNIRIGDGTTITNNVRIENVSMGMGNGILIMNKANNVVLIGASGPSSSSNYVILKNEYVTLAGGTFPTITGPFLGFYMFGGSVLSNQTCGVSGGVAIPCVALLDTSPLSAEWHQPDNH